MRREITGWTRDHPWQADGLLAAALLGFSVPQVVAGQSSAVGHAAFTVVTVLLAATVLARRRYPVAAFAVAAVIGALQITLGVQDGGPCRYRRVYYASLEERAARAEAERDAQARIAAAAERARELQDRRARAVDESAARLRRIERDLHDGAQVRLAALAMTLGEIKENLQASPADHHTRDLVGAAHQNAKDNLAELRDLARGIHPPVLDRGLGPALGILAGTSAIPVGLTVSLTERPSPAIEAMAYFCAAALFISQKVVEKHVANIFDKLGLAPDDNDNRRVIAALRYLES